MGGHLPSWKSALTELQGPAGPPGKNCKSYNAAPPPRFSVATCPSPSASTAYEPSGGPPPAVGTALANHLHRSREATGRKVVAHEPTRVEPPVAERHTGAPDDLPATARVGRGPRGGAGVDREYDPGPGVLPPPVRDVAPARRRPATGLRSQCPPEVPLGRYPRRPPTPTQFPVPPPQDRRPRSRRSSFCARAVMRA